MLVDNKNLFPLQLAYASLYDYYMDAEGEVYSKKRGALARLSGSTPYRFGSYNRTAGKTYTLNGTSYQAVKLKAHAQAHPSFKEETHDPKKKTPGGYGPATLSAAALGVDLTKVKSSVPSPDRVHATSVEAGIKGKGFIITRFMPGVGLIFSKQPAIHLTEDSARSEMERLAKEVPGTKFVMLKITNSIVSGGVTWE